MVLELLKMGKFYDFVFAPDREPDAASLCITDFDYFRVPHGEGSALKTSHGDKAARWISAFNVWQCPAGGSAIGEAGAFGKDFVIHGKYL